MGECSSVRLEPSERGQYTTDLFIDPFNADISFQAMLVWARTLRDSGALPNNLEKMEFHKPIPEGATYYTTIQSTTSKGISPAESVWKCKFFMHDNQGEVYQCGRSSIV